MDSQPQIARNAKAQAISAVVNEPTSLVPNCTILPCCACGDTLGSYNTAWGEVQVCTMKVVTKIEQI